MLIFFGNAHNYSLKLSPSNSKQIPKMLHLLLQKIAGKIQQIFRFYSLLPVCWVIKETVMYTRGPQDSVGPHEVNVAMALNKSLI